MNIVKMIFFEILGVLLMLAFFTFPLWIHNNWKVMIYCKLLDINGFYVWVDRKDYKETKIYLKELKEIQEPVQKFVYKQKICSKQQPFKIDEKLSIICNFACDGKDCQFEDLEKWKEKYNTKKL